MNGLSQKRWTVYYPLYRFDSRLWQIHFRYERLRTECSFWKRNIIRSPAIFQCQSIALLLTVKIPYLKAWPLVRIIFSWVMRIWIRLLIVCGQQVVNSLFLEGFKITGWAEKNPLFEICRLYSVYNQFCRVICHIYYTD